MTKVERLRSENFRLFRICDLRPDERLGKGGVDLNCWIGGREIQPLRKAPTSTPSQSPSTPSPLSSSQLSPHRPHLSSHALSMSMTSTPLTSSIASPSEESQIWSQEQRHHLLLELEMIALVLGLISTVKSFKENNNKLFIIHSGAESLTLQKCYRRPGVLWQWPLPTHFGQVPRLSYSSSTFMGSPKTLFETIDATEREI
jgi:hypothetical protein